MKQSKFLPFKIDELLTQSARRLPSQNRHKYDLKTKIKNEPKRYLAALKEIP